MTVSSIKELEALLKPEKCLALGEIGLDYHYEGAPRQKQKEALKEQLELAASLNKPVSLHERDACGDMLEILSLFKGRLRGVMHCFSGSPGKAEQFLRLGLYISFSGVLTFKNARQAVEAAQARTQRARAYRNRQPVYGARTSKRKTKRAVLCTACS